jgi:hypothetical protein
VKVPLAVGEQFGGLCRVNSSTELFFMPFTLDSGGVMMNNAGITSGAITGGMLFPTDASDTTRFSITYQAA